MSRWPVAGPSKYRLLASSPASYSKNSNTYIVQQIHIRWQQYTQDNYSNTHKTTTTKHTRQLQQYTQDNYNSTHKSNSKLQSCPWYIYNYSADQEIFCLYEIVKFISIHSKQKLGHILRATPIRSVPGRQFCKMHLSNPPVISPGVSSPGVLRPKLCMLTVLPIFSIFSTHTTLF